MPDALDDLAFWPESDPRKARRIVRLMQEVRRSPFDGMGKPEPLRGFPNTWSRRIDQEHRLVYSVEADAIVVLQCRYHYRRR